METRPDVPENNRSAAPAPAAPIAPTPTDGGSVRPAKQPKAAKKKKNQIGKPPAVLWFFGYCAMKVVYSLKYRVRVDRSAVRGVKGPALILAPHVSGKDHVLTALALYPNRPTYVLSEHFMAKPFLRRVLTMIHAIPKKMFCSDSRSVLNIIRAVREGNMVVLFPEGRLTWYGRSLALTAGTADLVRKLGVDVYTVISDGAGMTFPKWAAAPRRGKIRVRTEKLLSGEEAKALSSAEIDALLTERLRHDAELDSPGVKFLTRDTTAGLDGIIWRCPVCGAEDRLIAGGGRVVCPDCGLSAVLDEYGKLTGLPAGTGIDSVADWYEACAASLDLNVPLERKCEVGATDADGYMRRSVGEGVMRLDREKFTFRGTVFGEEVDFSVAADKLVAFPITVADHVDVYINNRLHYLSPMPDKREAVKFVAYLDRVNAKQKQTK